MENSDAGAIAALFIIGVGLAGLTALYIVRWGIKDIDDHSDWNDHV